MADRGERVERVERVEGVDRPEQVDDPALVAAARHALHDEELIAAFAVDGEEADDFAKARALIERCTTCRDLHADLVSIGSTIRDTASPMAFAAARPAPRDFRITPMEAARLTPGNALQRAVARVLAGAAMFGRPVGASLAALGIVGLLVGTFGLGQLGSAAPPQSEAMAAGSTGASAAPAPASTIDIFGMGPASSQARDQANGGPLASSDGAKETTQVPTTVSSGGVTAVQLLLAASLALIVLGLALLLRGALYARAWNRARHRT